MPADNHYYQLYAPLDPKEKAGIAATKLAKDFAMLYKQWGGKLGRGIAKYTFAYNEKYEGAPKDIGLALNQLRSEHPKIAFAHYGCPDLETDFMHLQDSERDRVLGGAVPDPERVAALDYSVLREVIRHIVSADIAESESRIDLPPELDEKIKLNNISRVHAIRIQHGALPSGRIDKYFEDNSPFVLDELRDHVVGVYEAAKKAIVAVPPPAGYSIVDAVFGLFRKSLFPKFATAPTATAVDAVIGYFFEACDVFDPKPGAKGLPGASP